MLFFKHTDYSSSTPPESGAIIFITKYLTQSNEMLLIPRHFTQGVREIHNVPTVVRNLTVWSLIV